MHPLIAVVGPVHNFPPDRGFGFTHRLVLNCMPLFVQKLHWPQSLQPPSTAKEAKTKQQQQQQQLLVFRYLNVDLCIR